jgi:moderate conductance mechanosensitive channel
MLERLGIYLREHAPEILMRLGAAVGLLIATYVVAKLLARGADRLVRRARGGRAVSLAPMVAGLAYVLVLGTGIAMALDQVGINVAALLAGAGVIGLAVGFGAQTLVKDCLSGFFLILDGVLHEGDIVSMDDTGGVVERVGIRVTQVRSFEGQLWYVPNGEIKRVGNWNRGWVRAVVEVGLAYEQDVERGLAVMLETGQAWAKENASVVLEPPEVQGVLGFGDSDVKVRLVVKLDNKNSVLWQSERELRKRIKAAFDQREVEIPFPRKVVYHRQEEEARLRVDAPLRQATPAR